MYNYRPSSLSRLLFAFILSESSLALSQFSLDRYFATLLHNGDENVTINRTERTKLSTVGTTPLHTSSSGLVGPGLERVGVSNETHVEMVRYDVQHVAPSRYSGLAYALALIFVVGCLVLMFYKRGVAFVFYVVTYIVFLSVVKIIVTLVYEYHFPYPVCLTSVHLIVCSTTGFFILLYRKQTEDVRIRVPTKSDMLGGILPIALTFAFSIASENAALVLVSSALSEAIAATSPAAAAFLTWLFGMDFRPRLLLPISIVIVGCAVSVSGGIDNSVEGVQFLFLSVVLRGLKGVLQQKLMSDKADSNRYDPIELMAWTCGFGFVSLALYSALTEGSRPYRVLLAGRSGPAGDHYCELIIVIVISCVIAFGLNMSSLLVLKQIGAIGLQTMSQMKSFLVVIGGMEILHESFTVQQQVGFVGVLLGIFWFARMEQDIAAEEALAAKAEQAALPCANVSKMEDSRYYRNK